MGATKTLLADFKGLVTAPGLLMRAEASFTFAQNVLFDAPGLARKRPGFERLPNQTSASIHTLHSSPLLNDRVIAHTGSVTPGALFYGTGSAAWTSIPSINGGNITRTGPAVPQRMALLGMSHYLTSGEGMRRVEAAFASARYAGMPRGLAPSTSNMDAAVFSVLQATNPWLASGNSVAYRVTWHRRDDSGQELGGPPTGRLTVRNIAGTSGFTGANRAVRLRIPIPWEYSTGATPLTTSYFFRLWRSRDGVSSEPDDELALVAQFTLTGTDLGRGYAIVDDVTPSPLLAAAPKLHTNPVGFPDGEANIKNGQLNADDAPPLANCVASWRECLWYADTQGKSASVIQLLSVGGTGLVAGQAVSFNSGVNEIVPQAARVNIDDFVIVTTLSTLALNIEATARNMVETWNEAFGSSTEAQAYYISVGSQQPGIILIECKQQSGSTASGVCVANPAAFRFGTPNTRSGGTNVIQYSKANRADACAVVNALTVGSGQTQILQLVPYRDFLLVFTSTGIYVVTGSSYADFNVAPFDLTFRLAGRELAVVADDKVYAWCREGIVEIDEGGCRVISTPIEPTLERIMLQGQVSGTTQQWIDALASNGFAVGYRLAHRVLFFYQSDLGFATPACLDALVFDTRTRAWSTLQFAIPDGPVEDILKSCGVPRFSDDKLVMGYINPGGGDGWAFLERRTYTSADYVDTDVAGLNYGVLMQLWIQFQVPDAGGAVHWQGTVVHFDGAAFGAIPEFRGRSLPGSFEIQYQTEWTTMAAPVAVSVAGQLARVEPPARVRRGNQMRFILSNGESGPCGFIGISQSLRIGSNFPRST